MYACIYICKRMLCETQSRYLWAYNARSEGAYERRVRINPALEVRVTLVTNTNTKIALVATYSTIVAAHICPPLSGCFLFAFCLHAHMSYILVYRCIGACNVQ